ncbi:hypothetical protein R1sor_012283 [Riccia sorocarpa]|uniref:F-box domain-containing protein n=1 Tax=Riccia sorocarpa TaxID=122646 RepID=A0ABD3I3C4_9MARC
MTDVELEENIHFLDCGGYCCPLNSCNQANAPTRASKRDMAYTKDFGAPGADQYLTCTAGSYDYNFPAFSYTAIADRSGAEATVNFPDDLLDIIIPKIPFPYILKARMLSRKWRSKFESFARCREWPALCPTFITSNYLLGFDRATDNWIKMGLKADSVLKIELEWTRRIRENKRAVEGVLLCGNDSITRSITIINLLTGGRRTIPYSHAVDHDFLDYSLDIVSVSPEFDKYQVVLYAIDIQNHGIRRILYDSRSMTWSSNYMSFRTLDVSYPFFAYLDGCMYFTQSQGGPVLLVEANFDSGYVRQVVIPYDFYDRMVWTVSGCPFHTGVMRCGSRIVVFILSQEPTKTMAYLFEVTPQLAHLVVIRLSESPLRDFTEGDFDYRNDPGAHPAGVVADKDCIYFYGRFYLTSYCLVSDTWNSHRIQFPNDYREASYRLRVCPVSFQPRLNPFIIV